MLYGFPLRPHNGDAYTRVTDAESYKNPIKLSALCTAILEGKKKTTWKCGLKFNSKAGRAHTLLALSCNVLAIHIPGSFPSIHFTTSPYSVLVPVASNFWATSVAGQQPPPSSTH